MNIKTTGKSIPTYGTVKVSGFGYTHCYKIGHNDLNRLPASWRCIGSSMHYSYVTNGERHHKTDVCFDGCFVDDGSDGTPKHSEILSSKDIQNLGVTRAKVLAKIRNFGFTVSDPDSTVVTAYRKDIGRTITLKFREVYE